MGDLLLCGFLLWVSFVKIPIGIFRYGDLVLWGALAPPSKKLTLPRLHEPWILNGVALDRIIHAFLL